MFNRIYPSFMMASLLIPAQALKLMTMIHWTWLLNCHQMQKPPRCWHCTTKTPPCILFLKPTVMPQTPTILLLTTALRVIYLNSLALPLNGMQYVKTLLLPLLLRLLKIGTFRAPYILGLTMLGEKSFCSPY